MLPFELKLSLQQYLKVEKKQKAKFSRTVKFWGCQITLKRLLQQNSDTAWLPKCETPLPASVEGNQRSNHPKTP